MSNIILVSLPAPALSLMDIVIYLTAQFYIILNYTSYHTFALLVTSQIKERKGNLQKSFLKMVGRGKGSYIYWENLPTQGLTAS